MLDIIEADNYVEVITPNITLHKKANFCAGLYSDRLARKTNPNIDVRITPLEENIFWLKKNLNT